IVNVLIQANDRISALVADLERTQTENTEVDDLVQILHVHLAQPETDSSTTDPVLEDDLLSSFLDDETDSKTETDSFLLDATNDDTTLESFLEDDTDFDSFLIDEKNDDVSLESFLEDDSEIDSFLIDDAENNQNNTSFLLNIDSDTTQNDAIDSLLFDTNKEKPTPQIATPSNAIFTVPIEEHDQELFEIFILQLREKFVLLNNNIVQLETSYSQKRNDLLTEAIETLESLKFSANYMAYEELTYFYSHWIDHILDAQKSLSKNTEVPLTFMRESLSQLQAIFPQLKAETIKVEASTENDILFNDNIEPTNTKNLQEIDRLFDDKEPDLSGENAFIEELVLQKETPKVEITPPHIVKKTPKEIISEAEPTLSNNDEDDFEARNSSVESELFHKLSLALDASVVEQAIISEPINEVFSTLLDSTEKQRKEVKKTETKDLILDVKTLKEANEATDTILPEPVEPKKLTPIKEVPPKAKTPPPQKTPPQKTTPKNKTIIPELAPAAPPKKVFKKSIRVDADKIDSLMNQVGELIVDRAYFFQLVSEISELQQYLKATGLAQKDLKLIRTFAYRFSEAILALGRTSNALQESVMKVRMLP
ncbi:MAG: hypothetical protein KAG10_01755, partial [Methylococcales bacterium]|nr:hypothetical protein [Methylococcales bacterium]